MGSVTVMRMQPLYLAVSGCDHRTRRAAEPSQSQQDLARSDLFLHLQRPCVTFTRCAEVSGRMEALLIEAMCRRVLSDQADTLRSQAYPGGRARVTVHE